MENGRAAMAALSADHKQAVSELHLPAGPSSNPYFSLSIWRSTGLRRTTEGAGARCCVLRRRRSQQPRFDPDDPYVQSAISDSVRAGLVVYTIYWRSSADGGDNSMTQNGGQSLMNEW
jgi:hypothetical protein